MSKPVFNYGDTVQAPYVFPHPAKRNEYTSELRIAKVIGFSHWAQSRRDWGWRGDMLVEFADGSKCWTKLH